MHILRTLPARALPGLLAVALLGLSGCGKDAGKLVPVEGKVTVGGKALHKGTVILTADTDKGNTTQEISRGVIDAEGHYKILTRAKEGAPLGWYKVTVDASDQVDDYKFVFLMPERYLDPRTSGLAYEVVESPAAGAYDLKLDAK